MKHLKTFESFTINNSEQINEELFGFGKKSPEELIEKGQKIINSDVKAKRIYNTIIKDESQYGENSANKYLMFLAKNKGNMIYATWKKEETAPDETKGFWVDRGIPRSGYDVQTKQLQ
jgi:DNA polymerase/3'-5' exonuclease PolX